MLPPTEAVRKMYTKVLAIRGAWDNITINGIFRIELTMIYCINTNLGILKERW